MFIVADLVSLNVFLYSYIKNCQLRFSHYIFLSLFHDDKTVISYFIPRHETLKFSYNFKAKRYYVNLMNKIKSEPKHFEGFNCD